MQLAKELAKECRTVEDIHNKLKELFKDSLQQILEAEMAECLGYEKRSPDGNNTGNSRNGYSKKTKDILGIWIGETESASFWLAICFLLGGQSPNR